MPISRTDAPASVLERASLTAGQQALVEKIEKQFGHAPTVGEMEAYGAAANDAEKKRIQEILAAAAAPIAAGTFASPLAARLANVPRPTREQTQKLARIARVEEALTTSVPKRPLKLWVAMQRAHVSTGLQGAELASLPMAELRTLFAPTLTWMLDALKRKTRSHRAEQRGPMKSVLAELEQLHAGSVLSLKQMSDVSFAFVKAVSSRRNPDPDGGYLLFPSPPHEPLRFSRTRTSCAALPNA